MDQEGRWLVAVEGAPVDVARVEEIVEADPSTTWTVERDAGELWLASSAFGGLDGRAVLAKADHGVMILNGLMRVECPGAGAVRTGAVCRLGLDGSRHRFLFADTGMIAVAGSSVTLTVTRADGTVEGLPPPRPPPPPLLDSIYGEPCGPADATMARTLQLFATAEHDWGSLYRVFEVIQAACPAQLKSWATKGERDRFCQSANHPAAGGPSARHALYRGKPVGPHTTVDEGRAFIRRLLMLWVDERRAQLTTSGGA